MIGPVHRRRGPVTRLKMFYFDPGKITGLVLSGELAVALPVARPAEPSAFVQPPVARSGQRCLFRGSPANGRRDPVKLTRLRLANERL